LRGVLTLDEDSACLLPLLFGHDLVFMSTIYASLSPRGRVRQRDDVSCEARATAIFFGSPPKPLMSSPMWRPVGKLFRVAIYAPLSIASLRIATLPRPPSSPTVPKVSILISREFAQHTSQLPLLNLVVVVAARALNPTRQRAIPGHSGHVAWLIKPCPCPHMSSLASPSSSTTHQHTHNHQRMHSLSSSKHRQPAIKQATPSPPQGSTVV
jgi:hypothetical protein